MNNDTNEIFAAFSNIKERIPFIPQLALVLGSGLGDFAETMQIISTIEYQDIKGFPVSTVHGHKGRYVFGHVDGVKVVCMQGRVHYYEGYSMQQVVLPIRLMRYMGAKVLFLTNAAGGVNKKFSEGSLMALTDSISALVPNPLIGANIDELGERFPDMSEIYSKRLLNILDKSARQTGIKLHQGIYAQFSGPSFESPAEIRWISSIADAVGMSTACEAIAAVHAGMEVCAISCITNMAAGISKQKLSHLDVNKTAERVKGDFIKLVKKSIINICKE